MVAGFIGPLVTGISSVMSTWLLMPILVPLFICFPAIDAQTRLIFHRYLGFRVTVKERSPMVR